jgi:hypothetical protein
MKGGNAVKRFVTENIIEEKPPKIIISTDKGPKTIAPAGIYEGFCAVQKIQVREEYHYYRVSINTSEGFCIFNTFWFEKQKPAIAFANWLDKQFVNADWRVANLGDTKEWLVKHRNQVSDAFYHFQCVPGEIFSDISRD